MKLFVRYGAQRKELPFKSGTNLLTLLRQNGYLLNAECGGRGVCNKCKVKVLSGLRGDDRGYVLACKTVLTNDSEIELSASVAEHKTQGKIERNGDIYGVAVDLGTTTIVASLVNLNTKKTLETVSVLNPQRAYGADVISRIKSANEGNADSLKAAAVNAINGIIEGRNVPFYKACIAGNTTMLHLLTGACVKGIGEYPFKPEFTRTLYKAGKELGIKSKDVIIMPSVGAFVGADIVAGALATNCIEGNNLLVDIGTNGEMFLSYNGKLISTSTAAGPCFEGANITCGMIASPGAIDTVYYSNGEVHYTVIGDCEPKGLSGSALIDAIAVMLDLKIIDENGRLCGGKDFKLTDNVYITQADIRAFQLGKSAVFSGIQTLLSKSNISLKLINKLYIAGGFGLHLNKENAVKVGLIPAALYDKIIVAGNTSLTGATMCLLDSNSLAKASKIAEQTQYLSLSSLPEFTDAYIENMCFEE